MTDDSEADRLIRLLALAPHPEGGHYRETFRDAAGADGRARGTAIYFLLRAGERSHWHRIDAAEIWHFYGGAPLRLRIGGEAGVTTHVLGPMTGDGQAPQIVVPPHAWQSAESMGDYTLVGCTVAPGFTFGTFELAAPDFEP
jgi:predicted cupin superfamily sugar epimerase